MGLIADKYIKMGLQYHEANLSYSEVARVFILLKRHIWLFFQDSNFAGQPFDVRSIVALNNRIALFFDRAITISWWGLRNRNWKGARNWSIFSPWTTRQITARLGHGRGRKKGRIKRIVGHDRLGIGSFAREIVINSKSLAAKARGEHPHSSG